MRSYCYEYMFVLMILFGPLPPFCLSQSIEIFCPACWPRYEEENHTSFFRLHGIISRTCFWNFSHSISHSSLVFLLLLTFSIHLMQSLGIHEERSSVFVFLSPCTFCFPCLARVQRRRLLASFFVSIICFALVSSACLTLYLTRSM